MRFAFVSRHVPNQSQIDLAAQQGITLEHIGDRDAFSFPAEEIASLGYKGVVVVHPMAALAAYRDGLAVGVFDNVNRAPVGAPPNFETTQFVVISPRDSSYHCPTCANACGEHCR